MNTVNVGPWKMPKQAELRREKERERELEGQELQERLQREKQERELLEAMPPA